MKRWLARFRRRLGNNMGAKKIAQLVTKAHRGENAREFVARQNDHGIANDCGLCALKNVTVNKDITLEEAFAIGRELQSKVDDASALGVTSVVRLSVGVLK